MTDGQPIATDHQPLDLTRTDVGTVRIGRWTAGDRTRRIEVANAAVARWTAHPWPPATATGLGGHGVRGAGRRVRERGGAGTRALNYAEWTDAQSHRDAVAAGAGTVGRSPEWQRVRNYPGMTSGLFRRYHPYLRLTPPPARTAG